MTSGRTVLAAPDKFRGSLTGTEAARAIAAGASRAGWACTFQPMADGGEGTLDAFGGGNRSTTVTGPTGAALRAPWRLQDDGTAVIESALASGLDLAGGAEGNDPMAATSAGTGQLLAAAIGAGARRVIVGLGGSAMSDGGEGALAALAAAAGDHGTGPRHLPTSFDELGVEVLVACDVRTEFTDAARVFGPQKGADPAQVEALTTRLRAQQDRYHERYGVDLRGVPGGGAAGGLGGALVVLGGRLLPGFDLIAEHVGLEERMRGLRDTDLVVTGEGQVDSQSFGGKTVGGVHAMARRHGIPLLVVAGSVGAALPVGVEAVSLVGRFGTEAAWRRPAQCLATAVAEHCRAMQRPLS